MPKKLFLSSTCYDLDEVRRAIEHWAKRTYTALLSDRATFPVDPGMHRHDVCLANAMSSDLMVLVISGRFGAPYFKDPNISVTWAEFRAATSAGVSCVVCVDRRVWNERESYRRDQNVPLTVTKDPRTFLFLNEIQAHAAGYWMEIYDEVEDIVARLETLAVLFPVELSPPIGRMKLEDGRVLVQSLSAETRHHIRLTVGSTLSLTEDFVLQAIAAIPREAREDDNPAFALDGFSILVSAVDASENRFIVRPSRLGEAILDELDEAFSLM
jgi:hypothetical protein